MQRVSSHMSDSGSYFIGYHLNIMLQYLRLGPLYRSGVRLDPLLGNSIVLTEKIMLFFARTVDIAKGTSYSQWVL